MATPLPIASSRYFIDVSDAARLNLMLLWLVMSVKVTGDCACGADGGGVFAGPDELYDLPVRAGDGEAAGCWHKTAGVAANSRKESTSCRKAELRHISTASTGRILYAGSRKTCKLLC